jgi:RNA polymerase sigma-70 factor (ECF subfamily)
MEFTKEIYDQYKYMVYKLAWQYTKDETVFKDLVQEGFIGLEKACQKYKKGFKFSTFAYHKIHGEIRSYVAYKKEIIHIPVDKKKSVKINYEEITEIEDKTDLFLSWDMENALTQLSEDLRDLIELHFYEGHSKKEISEITGLSYDSVVYRIEKALKKLREYL